MDINLKPLKLCPSLFPSKIDTFFESIYHVMWLMSPDAVFSLGSAQTGSVFILTLIAYWMDDFTLLSSSSSSLQWPQLVTDRSSRDSNKYSEFGLFHVWDIWSVSAKLPLVDLLFIRQKPSLFVPTSLLRPMLWLFLFFFLIMESFCDSVNNWEHSMS